MRRGSDTAEEQLVHVRLSLLAPFLQRPGAGTPQTPRGRGDLHEDTWLLAEAAQAP